MPITDSNVNPPFWQQKSLDELNQGEWESLCDHCGLCCLQKLEDIDTGKVFYTSVVCKLSDPDTCQCTRYSERTELVPDCLMLTPDNIKTLSWLPTTCAYYLLANGKGLPHWHPLVSGDPRTVHLAGISIHGKAISEEFVHPDEWEANIVDLKTD